MVDVSTLKGITQDSRQVKKGYLFAALPGSKADGRDYIEAAIAHGATAILAPEGTEIAGHGDVELLTDINPQHAFAVLAAEFYGRQPEHVVCVTGTNGKTSVVTFAEQLWAAVGYKATSIGTLKGKMTTPDPVTLHAELADLSSAGITHLAMEASSHGIHQHRMDGVKIEAAGFTNLTHDHLDYHKDMDAYFEAKARLFSEMLPDDGVAVLNADDVVFEKLKAKCEARGLKVLSYGQNGKDFKVLSIKPTAHGQVCELGVMGAHKDITLPLVGEFQLMNALCALGLVVAHDPSKKTQFLNALERLQGARGRVQLVPGHPKGAVYVDYAHTPDALSHVLEALRPHTKGRLICAFGCGGDRDKAKRSVMGEVAARLSDLVVVTDDNPRSESPEDIRAAVPQAVEIGGRREAIRYGVGTLEDGDVFLIAGKGHEQGQIFKHRTEPFDDVEEAEIAIKSINESKRSKE